MFRILITFAVAMFLVRPAYADRIHDVVRAGDIKETQKLLAASPEMVKLKDSSGRTPLHIAAANGHREIALLLINKGADLDAASDNRYIEGTTPLIDAIAHNRTEVAILLLGKRARTDPTCKVLGQEGGHTALHFAAGKANARVTKLLIDKAADLNAINDGEETPLYVACGGSSRDPNTTLVAKLLINAKADVTKSQKQGRTPLHQAAKSKLLDLCVALVDAGADLNAVDEKGIKPLTEAMKAGDAKVIKYLKDKGATE